MTQVLDPMLDTQSRFSTSVISKFEDNMDLQHVSINSNKTELCFGKWGEREREKKKSTMHSWTALHSTFVQLLTEVQLLDSFCCHANCRSVIRWPREPIISMIGGRGVG